MIMTSKANVANGKVVETDSEIPSIWLEVVFTLVVWRK